MIVNKVSNILQVGILLLFHERGFEVTAGLLRKRSTFGDHNRDESLLSFHTEKNRKTTRDLIVGGRPREGPNDYPYFVHLPGIECGGTLIAPDIVLTAGHCKVSSPRKYGLVHVGRHDYRLEEIQDGSEIFKVTAHVRHPYFTDKVCAVSNGMKLEGIAYDYLLLKLDGNSTKQVITLDRGPTSVVEEEELYVIGFGDTNRHPDIYDEAMQLHEGTVNYLSNEKCAETSIFPRSILPSMNMCATGDGEDGCQGDSGGPLLQRRSQKDSTDDVQVGIVSWGVGCGENPGIYARISEGYNWIRMQVCELSENPPSSFGCSSFSEPSQPPGRNKDYKHLIDHSKTVSIHGKPDKMENSEVSMKKQPSMELSRPKKKSVTGSFSGSSIYFPKSSFLESNSHPPLKLVKVTKLEIPSDDLDSSLTTASSNSDVIDDVPPMNTAVDRSRLELRSSIPHAYHHESSKNNVFSATSRKQFPSSQQHVERARSVLKDGSSCRSITDPEVCCSATEHWSTHKDQQCVPSKPGFTFTSGSNCEAMGWLEANRASNEYALVGKSEVEIEGFCDNLFASRRFQLRKDRPCSRMESFRACCMARDANGYPCIPSNGESLIFQTGSKCEPSTYVAHTEPENTGSCDKVT